jgi:pilus assembly protein CpaE
MSEREAMTHPRSLSGTEYHTIAIGAPPTFRQEVARALGASTESVAWLPTVSDAERFLAEDKRADLLVLSPQVSDPDALSISEFINRRSPTTAVVLVREGSPNGLLPMAMRAGIRDVVNSENGIEELQEVLERAIKWSASLKAATGTVIESGVHGKIYSVFSSKGGTGKTFLACNLAVAIAEKTGMDTALVDLDIDMGDVFSYFGTEPSRPLQDLIAVGDDADAETLKNVGTKLADNLWAFGAPHDPTASTISGDSVGGALKAIQRSFPYTIIDATADYSDLALSSFDNSTEILLISALDVVGVKHLGKAIETLMSIGISPEKLRIILNRADSKVNLTPEDVERVMSITVDDLIPSSRLVPLSLNNGRPVYMEDPKSEVAKSIAVIADKLIGEDKMVAPPADQKSKRRLFGRA